MTTPESKNQEHSDSALMLSFTVGEGAGFDLLYRRHRDSIYRFFYFGTGGDTALASELYQDVWMTVVRGRTRFTIDINFIDWLRHIAWARLYDHLRLHPAIQLAEIRSVAATGGNVSQFTPRAQAIGYDTANGLLGLLQELTEDQREIALLRYCFSMTVAEIAEFLDIGVEFVHKLQKEASTTLRRYTAETV